MSVCFCGGLGLVFSMPSQEIGFGKRLRNDLFCVEWDVKPQLNESINKRHSLVVCLAPAFVISLDVQSDMTCQSVQYVRGCLSCYVTSQ